MRYLAVLQKMGFKTLGDLENLIKDYSESAYQLALHQFAGTDLDIVALSVVLQNLCILHIVKNGGQIADLQRFYDNLFGISEGNLQRAQRTLEQVSKINII